MLEAVDLQCVRGERALFSGLGFRLRGGELLRIAGANGSGKTSLLRIVCGLLAPTLGQIRWRGEDIHGLREEFWSKLVYIGHSNAIKDDLTAAENLKIACTLAGSSASGERVGAALRRLGLAGCESLPTRVLSQGQRRRVALARLALSEAVPLWILDEPFTALDTRAVQMLGGLIGEHVAGGGMAIVTSHQQIPIGGGKELDL